MTSSTSDDNSVLLVHAYLDDELDPANALEIAQRISTDPALAAEGRRVTALRQLIHMAPQPIDVASSDLVRQFSELPMLSTIVVVQSSPVCCLGARQG